MTRFFGPQNRFQRPGVVSEPESHYGLQAGINRLIDSIRPTLGPLPRYTAIEDMRGQSKPPEILDSGGTIARRIVMLPGADADMGAMFVRQMLWRLHQNVGDGTATAAVLFQVIYNEGLRYIAAGGNAMSLRRHLEAGMRLILEELNKLTRPVAGKRQLIQLAHSICFDDLLAEMLGDIFDLMGEYGQVEFRGGQGRSLTREYFEGVHWKKRGLVSPQMVTNRERGRTDLEDGFILMSDIPVKDPAQLLPILTRASNVGIQGLLIIAREYSDLTKTFLTRKEIQDKMRVIAVETPGFELPQKALAIEDIARLVGGRPILNIAEFLENAQVEDLGQARIVWADGDNFGISRGYGDARRLRQHIAGLRAAYNHTDNPDTRQDLLDRLGYLQAGSATVWVGGATESDIKVREELAKRTAQAVRGALREGVLPGGGMALLACRPILQQQLESSADVDTRAAYRILLRAIEEPFRTLLYNAGYDPSAIISRVQRADAGSGFDLTTGQVVDMAQAKILDVAAAQKEAVRSAIASAGLALTIDVLVHRREIVIASKP